MAPRKPSRRPARKPRRTAKTAGSGARKRSAKAAGAARKARKAVRKAAATARKGARTVKKSATRAGKRLTSRASATKRKTAPRKGAAASSRKATTKAGRKRPVKPRKPAKKAATRPAPKPRKAPAPAAKSPKAAATRPSPQGGRRQAPRTPAAPPRLDRDRRTLPDEERMDSTPAIGDQVNERMNRAARTGREELREALREHTAAGPEVAGGDIDASWEDAYSVGDEAPGGDSPTPDQDRVDDIGRALGVEYQDNQELQGGDEIKKRDRERWEYDPASSDDWPHDK